jgi:hypothetical protein
MSMPQQSQTTSRTTGANASTRSVDVFGDTIRLAVGQSRGGARRVLYWKAGVGQ